MLVNEITPTTFPNSIRSLISTITREGQVLSPSTCKPPTPDSIGLSTTKTCTDSNSVLAIVSLFFQEQFNLLDVQTKKLPAQLEFYFSKCGIIKEEMLSFMTSPDSWPKPDKLAT